MRTKRTIQNVLSTFLPYIVLGILGFVKVRVFVSFLKDDLYSLNQLFYQILGYLTLVDAGFGLLIAQKMYKAFANNNHEEVSNIYSTAKIFFQRVGLTILTLGFIISFMVHYFTKAHISNLYIQIVFIIFLIRNTIDYFYCAPRYVIGADQKSYKINYLVNLIRVLQIVTEIILVSLKVNYLIVLIPSIFISIIMNIIINHKIYLEYPWLEFKYQYEKKYLKGTKDIISQKLAGLLHSNTDIILLSTFVNPLTVVIYTSYNYITKFLQDTIYIIADAINPSFANLFNDQNSHNEYQVYQELNMVFYFIAAFFSIMFFLLLNSFIKIWVGSKYVVSTFTLFLFILISYLFVSMRMNYIVVNSCGLFKETKNILLIEAIINMVLSIILVFPLGLKGVLMGTILATFITTYWYIPKYLLKHIFQEKISSYFYQNMLVLLITFLIIFIIHLIPLPSINNLINWIGYGIIYTMIIFILLFLIFHTLFKDFRALISKGKDYLQKRNGYDAN